MVYDTDNCSGGDIFENRTLELLATKQNEAKTYCN